MKRRTDQEQLLNDVLADEVAPGAKAASLDQMLRLVRRRRRQRLAQKCAAALALIAAVGVGLFFPSGRQKPTAEQAREGHHPPGCETVTSFALTSEQWVTTQPLKPGQLVRSESSVLVVHTAVGDVPSINDEELLELVRPNIAVLVRRGPHETELLFVESLADQN